MPGNRTAKAHAVVTLCFWAFWLAVIYWGSQFVAAHWPGMGDVLGILGSLLLFLPHASRMAWDVATSLGPRPRGPDGRRLPSTRGYAAFSWREVWGSALGFTLVGLGFGVNFVSKGL